MWRRAIRVIDSYESLLVLLLANFFLLEILDDPRWGAIASTFLSAAVLVIVTLWVRQSTPEQTDAR